MSPSFTAGDRGSNQDRIVSPLALHGAVQSVSKIQGLLVLNTLDQVQENILQVSFALLLDHKGYCCCTFQTLSGGDTHHSVMMLIRWETSVPLLFIPAL